MGGHDDLGFSVLEVVISTFVLFVALTAIMSLMVANALAGNMAKQKTTAINAIASYIEQVRALPYNQIGMPGGNPAGALVETPQTVGGYVIDIVPSVAWVDDPKIIGTENYKRLTIVMTARPMGLQGSVLSMTTQAIISPAGAGNNVVLAAPNLSWKSSSPTTNQVVWGNATYVGEDAHANGAGVVITALNLYCDSLQMRDFSGASAQFTPNTPSASCDFRWDTTAMNGTRPLFPDGLRTIKVEAWDSNSQQSYITVPVMVDNYPPATPVSVTATDASAGMTLQHNTSWPAPLDGTDPADHYSVDVCKQPTTATDPSSYSAWTPVTTQTQITAPAWNYNPSESFSRYLYVVHAFSPRNLEATGTAAIALITRPTIAGTRVLASSGTASNTVWSLTSTITFSGTPTFPYNASTVSNTLNRSTSPSGPWTAVGVLNSAFSPLPQDTYTNQSTATSYYYRATTQITPSGYAGGIPVTLHSNVIGPTGTSVASGSMANGGW